MLGEEAWIYRGNVDVYGKIIGRNQKRKRKGRRYMRILMHLYVSLYARDNKNGEKMEK